MHSRASAIRMKWKKKRERSNTKFIPDLSRRFYTRRRCPSVDDYVDVVRPTWCREKNHRCTWNHGLHPLRPSFLLSFASSSCIIPYLESCEPGETMRVVVVHEIRHPAHASAVGIQRGPIRGPKWQKESRAILFIPATNRE